MAGTIFGVSGGIEIMESYTHNRSTQEGLVMLLVGSMAIMFGLEDMENFDKKNIDIVHDPSESDDTTETPE